MSKKQVLIIGLDGFDWELARRLMSDGAMPFLQGFVQAGCSGTLQSVFPCETAPAWVSFQTGCLPQKTHVHTFHSFFTNIHTIELNDFNTIAVPTLWELLHANGKKVVALNMPLTFPPPQVDSAIVPGLLCPQLSSQTVHPSQVYKDYLQKQKNYRILNLEPARSLHEFIRNQIAVEKIRFQMASKMMNRLDWDLFFVQMQSTDHVQHTQWWALDPDCEGYCVDAYTQVRRFYQACDRMLSKLIAQKPQALTLLVSDHGFCQARHVFHINRWLKEKGFLVTREDTRKVQDIATPHKENWKSRLKQRVPLVKSAAKRYGRLFAKHPDATAPPPVWENSMTYLRESVDYTKTKVIALGSLGGLLYLLGADKEKEQLAEKISSAIQQDLGPGASVPLIKNVKKTIELHGQNLQPEHAPALVVELESGVVLSLDPLAETCVTSPNVSRAYYRDKPQGTHRPQGVWAARGPDIRGGTSADAQIVDMLPTLLAYMGIPVPENVDGNVIQEAFEQPLSVSFSDANIDFKNTRQSYTHQQQGIVEKHLADLGYL